MTLRYFGEGTRYSSLSKKKHIQWLLPVFLRESYGLIPCTSTVPLRPYFGLRICFIHRREKEKNKCRKYNLTAA